MKARLGIGNWVVGVGSNLNRTVMEGFIEKVILKQRPVGSDNACHVFSWVKQIQRS